MKNQTRLHLVLLPILLMAAAALYLKYYMISLGTLENPTTVVIRKGTSSREAAEQLAAAGVIRFPHLFFVTQYALGNTKKFKAGEYFFAARISPQQVAGKLLSGKVVTHKITVPEGMKSSDIRRAIESEPLLEGTLTIPIAEGSILPETYHFLRGDTRDLVAARMQQAMDRFLDKAWAGRDANLPLADKKEALVLASIVERETGVADERAHVASVFVNRLKQGIRLQTDPAVIYGLEQKNGAPLGRALAATDLEIPTPYNTYLNLGLPPTPIANPGKDAILAALHPLATNDLYFVATGIGGHHFSSNLEAHNRNVAAYRAELAKAAR